MVIDTQATARMHREVTNGGPTINHVIENPCSQFPRMTEDDFRIRPPTTKDGPGHHSVKIAIRNNAPYFQMEGTFCHANRQMTTPMVVSDY